MKSEPGPENLLVFSYLALRKTIGILGVSLPFTVSLGAMLFFQEELKGSISAYYYTDMRDVLVGTLFAIGFFMLSYQGYELPDRIAGLVVFVSAIGIAIFPTTPEKNPTRAEMWKGGFHYFFAALFFLALIYFCLFLFTKTNPGLPPTERKLQRNRVYRTCGIVMAACILLIAVVELLPDRQRGLLKTADPVFWLESIAILTFGISWLTKGEALLKDENNQTVSGGPG